MQATSYYGEVKGALQVLHALSSKRLTAEFAQGGHEIRIEQIDSCEIVLPSVSCSLDTPDSTESGDPVSLSNECVLPPDTPMTDEKSVTAGIEDPPQPRMGTYWSLVRGV